jgi:uncharacterized Zn-binding protein involved in type VI secretion
VELFNFGVFIMPGVSAISDMCTGHDGCDPRAADGGASSVLLAGQLIHRVGDHWEEHCGHDSVLYTGSTNVLIGGVGVARIGDAVECGSGVMSGSSTFLIG